MIVNKIKKKIYFNRQFNNKRVNRSSSLIDKKWLMLQKKECKITKIGVYHSEAK